MWDVNSSTEVMPRRKFFYEKSYFPQITIAGVKHVHLLTNFFLGIDVYIDI